MASSQELKEMLQLYEGQLEELRSRMSAGQPSPELLGLERDLGELIQLTSEQLLQARKAEILGEQPAAAGQQRDEEEEGDEEQEEEEEQQSWPSAGQQCSVLRRLPDGLLVRLNAVVHDVQPGAAVRVFLCNPTAADERPCNHFLESACRYGDAECRRSHGLLVAVANVAEYVPPDYELLRHQVPCLALRRPGDAVWHRASLLHSDFERRECDVRIAGATYSLPFGCVLPLTVADQLDEAGDGNDDQDEEDEEEDEEEEDEVDEEAAAPIMLWQPQTADRLGDWEQHTRGIGSRLLARMGHRPGEGLGACGRQGRAEPVPIEVLPAGRSLDSVMALRQRVGAGALNPLLRRRRRRAKAKATAKAKAKATSSGVGNLSGSRGGGGVFDLLNSRRLQSASEPQAQLSRPPSTHELIRQQSDSQLSRSHFAVQEDLRRCSADIRRIEEAMRRHSDSPDSRVFLSYSHRLQAAKQQLQQLQREERTLAMHKASRSDRRKLQIF